MGGDFYVATLLGDNCFDVEEASDAAAESFYDVRIVVGNAQAQAFRVPGTVAHEIPDELGEFGKAWSQTQILFRARAS